ncbi:MAG: FAD-dependent oxidoreductase [Gammaproteobacteria bacterium]
MTITDTNTVIVGAGIIGAVVAYNLAKNGDRPVLIDKDGPAAGITGASFGWLNAYNAGDRAYFDFRRRSMAEYKSLVEELDSSIDINWNGSLVWLDGDTESNGLVERLQVWGYPVEIVDENRAGQLEPGLATRPSRAFYAAEEGSVDPVSATRSLMDAAIRLGAEFRFPSRVTGINIRNSRVTGVETDKGSVRCDTVVVAAGHGAETLCRQVGFELPVTKSEALLVKTQQVGEVVRRVIAAPGVRLWQAADGSILTCDDFDGSRLADRPNDLAVELIDRANRLVAFSEPLEVVEVMIGRRLLPGDGLPVIGEFASTGGLYLALMHSGITLAPLAGRLIAGEITSGIDQPQLMPYRPTRFSPAA